MRTSRTIRGLAIAGVIALGFAGAQPVVAGDAHGWKTIHFRGTTHGGTDEDLGSTCDVGGNCVFVSRSLGGDELGGDLDGSIIGTTTSTTSSNGVAVIQQAAVFTGSIRGCGTGTMAYTNHGTIHPGDTTFTWVLTLETATGTGDFTGMSGQAVGHLDLTNPDATAVAIGQFRCRR